MQFGSQWSRTSSASPLEAAWLRLVIVRSPIWKRLVCTISHPLRTITSFYLFLRKELPKSCKLPFVRQKPVGALDLIFLLVLAGQVWR